MKKISTPDICDTYETKIADGSIAILEPLFTSFGRNRSFYGEAVTIKCFEDNSVLKELVATPGLGKVIVMDGGGSKRRAILGDMLAEKASKNGWVGMVINGCIRDVDEINDTDIGVKALATHPMKTQKRGVGDLNVAVTFGGHTIRPGYWVYADGNGILVSDTKLKL